MQTHDRIENRYVLMYTFIEVINVRLKTGKLLYVSINETLSPSINGSVTAKNRNCDLIC